MRRFLGWTALSGLVLLADRPAAFAHAMLVHSSPADQAVCAVIRWTSRWTTIPGLRPAVAR